MIRLEDLIDYLNEELQVELIEDFCPNGMQIQGSFEPIEKIVTAVSSSLKTIESAIQEQAQVLIVHHGLFWNKDPYPLVRAKREKIKLLLDHNITLLAYHLPLDCHKTLGNNWKAAHDMGWQNLKPFGPSQNGISLGVMGSFSERTVEQLRHQLEQYYRHHAVVALGGNSKVSSAALISGSAHREIYRAIEQRVDCFITGSFDEPIWDIAHEEKINFFAMGHYHSEIIGSQALGTYLANKFNLKHKFLYIPNPF